MDHPETYEHEVSMIFCSLEVFKALNPAFSRHFNISLMTDSYPALCMHRVTTPLYVPSYGKPPYGFKPPSPVPS